MKNPVYPDYFADPFAWRHDGRYYAVGTAPGNPADKAFPLLVSDDLAHWRRLGFALERPDPALGDTFWAPEVAYEDGKFHLYYSVGFEDKNHQLRVAVSERPEGSYRDCGEPLLPPSECAFAIDAHPFRDDDGQWYLFFARDFLDTADDIRAGTALTVHRLETMTRLSPDGVTVARARYDWQRFQSHRPMYGGRYDWHTLEGPAVRKHDGKYYCFYSGGRWENDSYGVDYAVADRVMGPYRTDCPDGARVLRTVPGKLVGPGHNSFVKAPDGRTDIIVYHAWDPAMTARRMCVDPLVWTPEGPRVRPA